MKWLSLPLDSGCVFFSFFSSPLPSGLSLVSSSGHRATIRKLSTLRNTEDVLCDVNVGWRICLDFAVKIVTKNDLYLQ